MRLVKFLLGLAVAAVAGLALLGSSYALLDVYREGISRKMLYPGLFVGGSVIGMLIGLRMFLRAIFPSFTFTRLLLITAILIAALHFGGYAMPSNSSLKILVANIKQKIEAVTSDLKPLVREHQ